MSTIIPEQQLYGPGPPFVDMDELVDFVFHYIGWKLENDEQFRADTAGIWARLSLDAMYFSHPVLLCALFYRSLGWSVFPVKRWSKDPSVKWKELQTRLPTYRELLIWFTNRKNWGAGIALVLGPVSNVFCIDVDGVNAHEALVKQIDVTSDDLQAVSGSHSPGKYHLFYRHPEIQTISSYRPWEETLEFRGNKGIVVLPPSTHKSGLRYEWGCDIELLLAPLHELPKPVFASLAKKARSIARPVVGSTDGRPSIHSAGIARLEGGDRDFNLLGYLPLLCRNTKDFINGKYAYQNKWNDRLFRAACDMQARSIPEDVAISLLLKGARPITQEDVEKAARTIQSAYAEARTPGREYRRKR